jgi:hypothetical protein
MKQFYFFLLALLALLSSCGNNGGNNNQAPQDVETITKTGEFVNNWLNAHPDVFNNEITKKRGIEDFEDGLMKAAKEDTAILRDVVYVYKGMLPYSDGKTYAVKFEQDGRKIHSRVDCGVYLTIMTVLTEEQAAPLVENSKYMLSWESIDYVNNKNFRLPSGRTVDSSTSLYKDPIKYWPVVSLRLLVAKGLKFESVN